MNAARSELSAFGVGHVVGVGEEDDIGGPLPHELGVLHRAGMRTEYPEGLVAHFPPVAVRTVQKISSPSLANTGDVRQLIAHAGREHDAPSGQNRTPGETKQEPGLDAEHLIFEQLHAVPRDLGPARGEKVCGRHAVARQEALHVRGRSIPGRARVDHRDPSPGSTEDERGAEPGRASADDHHVEGTNVPGGLGEHAHVVRELLCVLESQPGRTRTLAGLDQRGDLDDLTFSPGG